MPSQTFYRIPTAGEYSIIENFILNFYEDSGEAEKLRKENIRQTFEHLEKYPEKGQFIVFENRSKLIGYALLINFWSNEYGGNMLTLDELYLIPEYRNKGIGTDFIKSILDKKVIDFKILKLEVLPYNKNALRLYEKIGFKKSDRDYLFINENANQRTV